APSSADADWTACSQTLRCRRPSTENVSDRQGQLPSTALIEWSPRNGRSALAPLVSTFDSVFSPVVPSTLRSTFTLASPRSDALPFASTRLPMYFERSSSVTIAYFRRSPLES